MEPVCNLHRSTLLSSDGKTELACYAYVPTAAAPRAVIEISHGMCEYIRRYENFAETMCALGYAVCGHDHRGHGESVKSADELGFFANEGGAQFLVNDLYAATRKFRSDFEHLPLILLGHSMGSFVARQLVATYGDAVDAVIISGTGGPESPTAAGKAVAKAIAALRGAKHRSKLLKSMSTGNYYKKFGKNAPKSAWLTREHSVVEKYDNDPLCQFTFTARGYYDLFDLLGKVSSKDWAKKVRRDLPILMISGENDPVGNFGKGVKAVYDRLRDAHLTDLTLKLYPEGRHEMLNESNRAEVIADIHKWLQNRNF